MIICSQCDQPSKDPNIWCKQCQSESWDAALKRQSVNDALWYIMNLKEAGLTVVRLRPVLEHTWYGWASWRGKGCLCDETHTMEACPDLLNLYGEYKEESNTFTADAWGHDGPFRTKEEALKQAEHTKNRYLKEIKQSIAEKLQEIDNYSKPIHCKEI